MTSTNHQKVSGNPTPDEIRRYKAAVERFRAESKISTANGKPSPDAMTGPTPPEARPSTTSSAGMKPILECSDDLFERLARLATAPKTDQGPPLETYTTTPGPHGDVVSATAEYRAFMRSRYPGYGTGSHGEVRPLDRSSEGVGGEPSVPVKAPRYQRKSP